MNDIASENPQDHYYNATLEVLIETMEGHDEAGAFNNAMVDVFVGMPEAAPYGGLHSFIRRTHGLPGWVIKGSIGAFDTEEEARDFADKYKALILEMPLAKPATITIHITREEIDDENDAEGAPHA